MASAGTYGEEFDAYLSALIHRTLGIQRQQLFAQWVTEYPFGCDRCGQSFSMQPGAVDEDALILCDDCGGRRR